MTTDPRAGSVTHPPPQMKGVRWGRVLLAALLLVLLPIGLMAGLLGVPVAIAAFNLATDSRHLAAYAVPGSQHQVEVELQPTSIFAEYRRRLYLQNGGRRVAAFEMFEDTGGYARANLCRAGPERWLIRTFFQHAYAIDLADEGIQEVDGKAPASCDFVGAFDFVDREWRFTPASERQELPVTP